MFPRDDHRLWVLLERVLTPALALGMLRQLAQQKSFFSVDETGAHGARAGLLCAFGCLEASGLCCTHFGFHTTVVAFQSLGISFWLLDLLVGSALPADVVIMMPGTSLLVPS